MVPFRDLRLSGGWSQNIGVIRYWAVAACLTMLLAGHCGIAQHVHGNAKTVNAAAPAPADRVDINRASLQELLKVPGLTESWAGRILRYRPYRTKLDLTQRGIVTSEVYDRIKDYIIAHRDAK